MRCGRVQGAAARQKRHRRGTSAAVTLQAKPPERLLFAPATCLTVLMCCGAQAFTQPSHVVRLAADTPPRCAPWASALAFGNGFTSWRWGRKCLGAEAQLASLTPTPAAGRGGVSGGVWMKANRKNKRRREQQQDGEDGRGALSPQRVTKDAPISVRAQIKYAKIKKSIEKGQHPSATKKSTNSYRREKKLDYEDIVEPEDLSKVYMPDIAPSLMVDGYNIIFYWSKCCILADNGKLEEARRVLVDELDTLAAMRGWTITVVFDAHKRKGGRLQGYTTANKIEVIYTPDGESADMYVERQTMELKDGGCPNVMVATGDKLMQSLVIGAGAEVFSPDRLIEEIEICQRETVWYTDMYMRRKEKYIDDAFTRDMANSVRYVEVKPRSKGKSSGGGAGDSRGSGRGQRTYSIEDDFF